MEEQKKAMEEQNGRIMIDYVAHEADMAIMERVNSRLWKALLVVIVLFVVSNAFWIWRESQFEDVITATETVTQDTGSGSGDNTFSGDFIGGDYYGETNSNKNGN
jgi:hypothetical protein